MAVRPTEHGTAGSRLYGHGGEGGWQWASSCAALVIGRCGAQVEATTTVRWCGLARRACCGGAVVGEHTAAVRAAAAVERKASGRREGGVQEPQRSWSRSGCVICFIICGDWRGADRNNSFWTSGPPTGALGADGRMTPSITDYQNKIETRLISPIYLINFVDRNLFQPTCFRTSSLLVWRLTFEINIMQLTWAPFHLSEKVFPF
jgi:hypothetical protein